MKQIANKEQVGFKALILLLLFFDFLSKFVAYQFLSDISPFPEIVDVRIAVSIGDFLFLALLLLLFGSDIRRYLSEPTISKSLIYGLSLYFLFVGCMAPVGYLSLKIDPEFFYSYWWNYVDVPVFAYAEHLFSMNFELENIIFFTCLAVFAPVVEEPLYRIVFYRVFRRSYSPFTSIIIVAIVFAVVHPTYFFLAFFSSLALSFLIYQTGSVWSAIIAHAIYNSLAFVDAYYLGIERFKPLESIYSFETWSVQLAFLPVALVVIYVFFKNNKAGIKALRSLPRDAGGDWTGSSARSSGAR